MAAAASVVPVIAVLTKNWRGASVSAKVSLKEDAIIIMRDRVLGWECPASVCDCVCVTFRRE